MLICCCASWFRPFAAVPLGFMYVLYKCIEEVLTKSIRRCILDFKDNGPGSKGKESWNANYREADQKMMMQLCRSPDVFGASSVGRGTNWTRKMRRGRSLGWFPHVPVSH